MGARLRRSGKASIVAFIIATALIGSAWLAFATTAPGGPSNGYGTTTTTAKVTTTTTVHQNNPKTKDDCKNGGWVQFGFKNQGQCIRFIETGKDSRIGQ